MREFPFLLFFIFIGPAKSPVRGSQYFCTPSYQAVANQNSYNIGDAILILKEYISVLFSLPGLSKFFEIVG